MEIGVMVNNLERDRLTAFTQAVRHGFHVVHTSALPQAWLVGPERDQYLAAARDSGVRIAAMFVGFDGQNYADRDSIARTVGLAVPALRVSRYLVAVLYSYLARDLGVDALGMHLGFLPPEGDGEYRCLVECVRCLLDLCDEHGQTLHLETGQESAQELLRFIHDVDRPSLGVNFDPANFLLYGTDEPLAALDLLAPLVRGVHCKDGLWPELPGQLGREVPIGQGQVPFPKLIRKLHDIGFAGPLVIEREQGPRVVEDILEARQFLEEVLRTVNLSQDATSSLP
jgi:sugar phosphate isomerase/epimerase